MATVVLTPTSVRPMREPAPSAEMALLPADRTLPRTTVASPPLMTVTPMERGPLTETAVSVRKTFEPASSTEAPCPKLPPDAVIALPTPSIRTVPPVTARTPPVGFDTVPAPVVTSVLPVSETDPPFSARAALASVAEVLAVMPVALIWLPAPVAISAWLPTGDVPVVWAPDVATWAPLPSVTCPPSSAATPNAPRDATETEPPEKLRLLPLPDASRPR